MRGLKTLLIELALLFIITIPSFLSLLNNAYFTMHDDQHVVRLYLLDQGIKQADIYPRWVDELGFGFGYPLYNFYPPFIYYLAELFHLLGFSYIWSIKLLIMAGFFLASIGIFYLMKRFIGRAAGFLSAALYTFFFYHSITVYVRGALAEFFSFSILPFLFLTIDRLNERPTFKNGILFGILFAVLILIHPLIAFPMLIFFPFFFIFYTLIMEKNTSYGRGKFLLFSGIGLVFALSLSSFFWLPSVVEKNYTLTNTILTGELADYKLHYIYPEQFIYSPWGYGGSTQGPYDGLTFQLGKIHLFSLLVGIVLLVLYFYKKKRIDFDTKRYLLFVFLLLFSLFMTTQFSGFVWSSVSYLSYLQFPWRFLTFAGLFLSIVGGYVLFFSDRILQYYAPVDWYQGLKRKAVLYCLSFLLIAALIFIYGKYFRPQKFITMSDKERTSFEEVAWRISRTSYEFIPKGVKTKKTELGTTILDIDKSDLPKSPYKNTFREKVFKISSIEPFVFRLNTYNFPGWKASLSSRRLEINDANDFNLITVNIPAGNNTLRFNFEDTNIRKLGNAVSLITFIILLYFLLPAKFKKIRS
ncbi:glycosyltransferase family 39 protein [Candidatus Roizmanbacteria bacterium]|nr:glycosyltransferase family 39 protein [Candidatus Roizmanbacteria bacterium]